MTPPERYEIRKLAQRIVDLADERESRQLVEDLDPKTIIDLATELVRLDNMRETWECAECGLEWCGPAVRRAGQPIEGHVCKPTMLVTT